MRPTAFVLATLLATVSLPALAQDTKTTMNDAASICQPGLDIAPQLEAATTPEAKEALIRAYLAANPDGGVCLVQAVQAQQPASARGVFTTVVAILGESDANAPKVEALTEAFPDMLASTDADIEPAAGDTTDTPTFDTNTDVAPVAEQENPSQLGNTNAVSPNQL